MLATRLKTTPYLKPKGLVAFASLLAASTQAQGLAGGDSGAVGLGAAGGLILLLLAWAASLRLQLRRALTSAGLLARAPEADAPRQADPAEVANTVLHNVGNVLNSVNTSASVLADKVNHTKLANLAKAAALLREHAADLADFLTHDPKGSKLPDYFATLAVCLADEQKEMLAELSSLQANIDHIKEIVAMQQSYARMAGLQETLHAADLIEDSLRLNAGAFDRHQIQVVRDFSPTPLLLADKHKVLQILVNLIRNAKYAMEEGGHADKRMILRVAPGGNKTVKISVMDNGVGIAPGHLERIFEHGFTTRKNGHGFALHSGALAARQMGGRLTCHSAGPGQGATFTLELPLHPPEADS